MSVPNRILAVAALAMAGAAAPALAQAAPDTATYLAKAGASDKFELSEARLMTTSADPQIKTFAQHMITDHTKSSADIKTAATADRQQIKPAMLDEQQKSDLAALKAAKGKARDALYVQQQKPAHQQALDLQQAYAAGGTDKRLKDTAGKIVPVVQSHIDMLNQMPAM